MFHTAPLQVLMTSGEQNVPRKLRIVFLAQYARNNIGCCVEQNVPHRLRSPFISTILVREQNVPHLALALITSSDDGMHTSKQCDRWWGTKCSPGTTVSLYLRSMHSTISRVGNKMFPTHYVVLILTQHTQQNIEGGELYVPHRLRSPLFCAACILLKISREGKQSFPT
jgi:hypothetical protein